MAGALGFQSCSGTDDTVGTPDAGPDQIISLAVANGNGAATRTGRSLLSSAADQSIENVVVYVVNASDNTIVATKTFNDWQNESADYRINDGRYTEFLLDDKLDDGTYRIFAVGYHDNSDYGDIPSALVSGSTFQENAVLTLGTDNGAEELFAGSTEPFAVLKAQGFNSLLYTSLSPRD